MSKKKETKKQRKVEVKGYQYWCTDEAYYMGQIFTFINKKLG